MKSLLPTLALTAAAAVAFVAPSADAGSNANTYYLHGYGGLAKTHTYVHDDVTITAHATAKDPKTNKTYKHNVYVGQYSNGLGVSNSVYRNKWGQLRSNDGSHTVDGKGYDDTLWLSFTNPFKITGAVFNYVGKYYDDVKVVDGDGKSLGWFNLSRIANKWGQAHLDLSGLDYSGTTIGFAAVGNHDSFKVKAVKGHVVPTPSAAAAGLLGLAALTARRRRQTEEAEA
ncbi:MAG: hypothetical protein AAGH99_08845 [Planctomycetota bacterium]